MTTDDDRDKDHAIQFYHHKTCGQDETSHKIKKKEIPEF